MHGVTAPHHLVPLSLNVPNQGGQLVCDVIRPHADDTGQPPGLVVWVQDLDEAQQIVRLHRWAHLDANRVADAPRKLDVGVVQLPGSVANPDRVRGAVVPMARALVLLGQGFFIVQQQRLVRGIDGRLSNVGVVTDIDPAGFHKGQCLANAVRHILVFLPQRTVPHKRQIPLMHLVKIAQPPLGKGAQHIQCDARLAVGLQQPLRVGGASSGGKGDIVHHVSPVGRQFHPAGCLGVGGSGFGKLSRQPPHFDHRAPPGKGQHHRHLQQNLAGVLDLGGIQFGKTLGAVASLQQKGLSLRYTGQLLLQFLYLVGKYQGWRHPKPRFNLLQGHRVRVIRLL